MLSNEKSEIEKQLRNKIAHYDFTIISKGKLSVQEKEIDIIRRAIELNSFVKEIVEMLNRTTEIVKANLDSKANEIRQLMDELQKRKIKKLSLSVLGVTPRFLRGL